MRSALAVLLVHLSMLAAGCSAGATRTPKTQSADSKSASSAKDVPGRVFQAPGSRVRLWLPETSYRPTRLLFFHNKVPNLAVVIGELTAANDQQIPEILTGLKQGAQDLGTITELSRGSAKGFIARGKKDGLDLAFVSLQDGRALTTVAVGGDPAAKALADRIVESIELDGATALDPLAIHGVRIGRFEGMEVWPDMSQPISLREPGVKPPFPPDKASLSFVISPIETSNPNPTDEDLQHLLGGLINGLKPDMEQAKSREIGVNGRSAAELVVPGENNGHPVVVYGFVTRQDESLFAGFGHVGKARANGFIPKFGKIVESISLDEVVGALPDR